MIVDILREKTWPQEQRFGSVQVKTRARALGGASDQLWQQPWLTIWMGDVQGRIVGLGQNYTQLLQKQLLPPVSGGFQSALEIRDMADH